MAAGDESAVTCVQKISAVKDELDQGPRVKHPGFRDLSAENWGDFSPDLTQELDQTRRKTRLNQQKMKIEPAKHPEGFTRMGINGLIEVYQLRLRIQHQPTRNGLQSRYKPGNEWIDMSNIFVLNSLKWYDGPNGLPFVTWAESAPVMRWES